MWGGGGVTAFPLLLLSASIAAKARKSIGKIREPAALGAIEKERATNLQSPRQGLAAIALTSNAANYQNTGYDRESVCYIPHADAKKLKVKRVTFVLEQAMKVPIGSRGTALLFL
jgi:hypothetical protein